MVELSKAELQRIKLQQLTNHLSDRMSSLCTEVLQRLPDEWDEYLTLSFEESDETPEPSAGTIGYANAFREEEGESFPDELPDDIKQEQCWVVTLFIPHLNLLSDSSVKWVIAHELGHVASNLRTGSLTIGGVPITQIAPGEYEPAPSKDTHEDAAEGIALEWGFSNELQGFMTEIHYGN